VLKTNIDFSEVILNDSKNSNLIFQIYQKHFEKWKNNYEEYQDNCSEVENKYINDLKYLESINKKQSDQIEEFKSNLNDEAVVTKTHSESISLLSKVVNDLEINIATHNQNAIEMKVLITEKISENKKLLTEIDQLKVYFS
jgi:hypothetical protein